MIFFGFEEGFQGFRLLRIQWCKKFEPIPWEFSDIPWPNLTNFEDGEKQVGLHIPNGHLWSKSIVS